MMLAWKMRRTSPRCMARHAMRSWFRICRGSRTAEGLEDCPEDLYLIEGDPQSFDDSVFSVDELEKAVVVKIADRQWRYSRFPSLPLFGARA